ncbi:hypothetical protein H6P81_019213 [Aristolochia fimbriata]|uniref:Uncharacterized protein n=1 Tax=Aristolochia fimbriata TaxID=158543 RepID=A0AAV7DRY1_ARIFI|nr:hypothetical protein H6P81_019213 [Aristolochia fimbriata]
MENRDKAGKRKKGRQRNNPSLSINNRQRGLDGKGKVVEETAHGKLDVRKIKEIRKENPREYRVCFQYVFSTRLRSSKVFVWLVVYSRTLGGSTGLLPSRLNFDRFIAEYPPGPTLNLGPCPFVGFVCVIHAAWRLLAGPGWISGPGAREKP